MTRPTAAPTTLRQRLLRSLLIPLVTLAILGVLADYFQAHQLADDAYDQVLASTAIGLASRLELERDGDLKDHFPTGGGTLQQLKQSDTLFYAVFDAQHHLVVGMPELHGIAKPLPHLTEPYFHNEVLAGLALRVATYAYAGPEGHGTIVVAEPLHKREKAIAVIVKSIAWTNLLIVLFTLTVVYFAVRHALRPVDALSEQFEHREAKDLRPLSQTGVPGELRPLVDAANQLMRRLRESALSQEAFLSNTAHQLRTPLAGLQTQLELLSDELPTDAQARLVTARQAVSRLAHLTHQMLALARVAPHTQVDIAYAKVDLSELLEDVASICLDRALARDIDLGFDTAPDPISVTGSQWMLRELLTNLVDNAIAYTPPGGRVTVSCGQQQGAPYLAVDDTGPGIPETDRDKVFDRFYRGYHTTSTGSGLGLAIVREIAERHGATVELGAGSSGQGTCIRVRFQPDTAPHTALTLAQLTT
jgi:two-component system sensor histidine kinase TctE